MAPLLLKIVLRHGADVSIECGNLYTAIISWLVWLVTRRPYRVYTYGTELIPLKKNTVKTIVLRRILADAERLYALGGYTRQLLAGLGLKNSVEILPPKIVLPPAGETRKPANNGRFSILCVGRLVEHKGQHILIQAAGMLPADCDWELILVGDGPQRKNLETICSRLPFRDRICLAGTVSDDELAGRYRAASALALPSLETGCGTEGFGIVLLEAMAYDIPIVASATGGIPEVLDHGRCGLLVTPGIAGELAHALRRLWSDNAFCHHLTSNGRQHLLAHYVWNR